jgi:hypothetical protein
MQKAISKKQKVKSKKNGGGRSTWLEKNEKGGVVG